MANRWPFRGENLFNSVESALTSRQIILVTNISAVFNPRLVRGLWVKVEESEVAVGHIVVLGAVQ